jgi:hypothetical protein
VKREEIGHEPPPERDGRGVRHRQHPLGPGQPGCLQLLPVAGEPPLRARVHPRAEKADARVALRDEVAHGGARALHLAAADHHVDGVGAGLEHLHDRAADAAQDVARLGALVDPGHDHARRVLRREKAEDVLLPARDVAGVGDLRLPGAVVGGVHDAAQEVGEDRVGDRGNHHADHPRPRRGEHLRGRVRHVAEACHGVAHPGERLRATRSGVRRAREAVIALTPAFIATSCSV